VGCLSFSTRIPFFFSSQCFSLLNLRVPFVTLSDVGSATPPAVQLPFPPPISITACLGPVPLFCDNDIPPMFSYRASFYFYPDPDFGLLPSMFGLAFVQGFLSSSRFFLAVPSNSFFSPKPGRIFLPPGGGSPLCCGFHSLFELLSRHGLVAVAYRRGTPPSLSF